MSRKGTPDRGDVYWVDPNPIHGREMRNKHPFVVITPKEVNKFGISMMVPITSGGNFSRAKGFTVVISGHQTNGVAICNQVRSFDLESRVTDGMVEYIETLEECLTDEIVDKVLSLIDPSI
jgi:mRNA interferase ChpB